MSTQLNCWDKITEFPPMLIRLLAMKGRGHSASVMSDEEIASASGLELADIQDLSRAESWDGFRIGVARRFLRACGADPADPKQRHRVIVFFSRETKFHHLQKNPLWEPRFKPVLLKCLAKKRQT